jgi:hypothetical protein
MIYTGCSLARGDLLWIAKAVPWKHRQGPNEAIEIGSRHCFSPNLPYLVATTARSEQTELSRLELPDNQSHLPRDECAHAR